MKKNRIGLHLDVADEEAAKRATVNAGRIIGEMLMDTIGQDRTLFVEVSVLKTTRKGGTSKQTNERGS